MNPMKNALLNISNAAEDFLFGKASLSSISYIERSYIDQSISLGSLYDASKCSVEGILNIHIHSKMQNLNDRLSCHVYKGNDIQRENFLKILNIDDETRLNVALNIVEPIGILSIVNYPFPIDNLTRFIYYFHQTGEESLVDDLRSNQDSPRRSFHDCSATHVVTNIKSGIKVAVILQLVPQDHSSIIQIDNILQHMAFQLTSNKEFNDKILDEEFLLANIRSTNTYSNINDIFRLKNISDIYRQIQIIQRNPEAHTPLTFKMRRIKYFYPNCDLTKNIYKPIDRLYSNKIETYLLTSSSRLNVLKQICERCKTSLLKEHLYEILDQANRMILDLNNFYLTECKLFQDFIKDIHHGQTSQNKFDELFNTREQRSLEKTLDDLTYHLDNLKLKKDLIDYLENRQVNYLNVANTDVDQYDNQDVLQDKLIQNNPYNWIFCSNDKLITNNEHQWKQRLLEFVEERSKNEKLHLVYADFSYSSFDLKEIKILKLKKQRITTESSLNLSKRSCEDDSTINILLFGESGVGKSTFINAFANYLQFRTIDEARTGEPIVVIPVSFLMTINEQFQEKLIQFGHRDSNENHNDLGQSVTQQCKSYEFNNRNGKTLKIIDTPGFGDTRGQDQDDTNINEIISFIQNLSHLNALCILLKPNVKQLNPSFRSSFTKLLDHLGVHFHQNIFFCFTNSQSTFFSVGDTGPVLNKFLQTQPQKQIQMKKDKTFCFDSESFRYLVASQHSIEFDQHFIHQFEQSWLRSVEESNRLVNSICLQEKQIKIEQKWISIEQIKREINHLILPMLETIRKILLSDDKLINNTTDYSSDDMISYLNEIIKACANFDYFLNDNGQTKNDGPFLSGINRMINEQRNRYHRLEELKEKYYKDFHGINAINEDEYLKSILSRIEGMKNMPMIYQQINPI